MKAGYENMYFYISVEASESGAGLGNAGYQIAVYEKTMGAILMLKKRRIFLPENKESPKFLAWMAQLYGERA